MAAENESRRTMSSARLRETEGLDSFIIRDPREVLRWKDENPLRLVAAAMVDMRGRAAKKDIQVRVVPDIVALEDWENWWKVVQPAIRGSQHFDYNPRSGTRLRGTKPSDIEAVALGDLSAKSRKTGGASKSTSAQTRLIDWITWTQADAPLPIPSRGTPPADLPNYLRQQPAALVPTAVSRLLGGIEERVLGASQPPKTSDEWVKSLAASLSRWLEIRPAALPGDLDVSPNSLDFSLSEIVGMTMRLSDALEPGDCESLFRWFADYTSSDIQNAKIAADAILSSSRAAPSEATTLFEQVHRLLGEPARKALWQRLITSDSGQISSWLSNRWRNMPSDSEKGEIVSSLIVSARDSDSIGDLDSLLSDMWNMAESNLRAHLFNPILMGWILHREMMPKVESVLRKFAEEIGNDDGRTHESAEGLSHENPIMRQWIETVKAASQNKIGRLRAEHQREIAEKDRLLSVAESEIERVDKGKTYFQEKLREAASSTSLRFNRDAIVMLGEWFRDLSESPLASHPDTRGVQEKIKLALLALGAEPFGQVGEVVPFDLISHEADPPPPQGSHVKIIAPGVAHVRDEYTPRTMVKVRVKVEGRA